MLWIAALLSLILWTIGWQSGFLGALVHVFLLLALLSVLAALLPSGGSPTDDAERDEREVGRSEAQ